MPKALLLLGVLALAGSAHGAGGLPPASFTAKGSSLTALAASGPTAALATAERSRCVVRFFRPASSTRPALLRPPDPCGEPDNETFLTDLWLSRTAIGAIGYTSPSPHGEDFDYLGGPRPAGPLRSTGDSWGWQDSEQPYGYGCRQAVVSGAGVIARASLPHRLGYDHGLGQGQPACPAGATTAIAISGSGRPPRLSVPGIWEPLAVDGTRILLAELDTNGERTGRLSLLGLDGKRLRPPAVDPALAKIIYQAWLTTEGLVHDSRKGLYGVGWRVPPVGAVTVGLGRVVYQRGRQLRVHRVKGRPDRLLLTLPRGSVLLAAGSFGVAVAIETEETVRLHRLPWRTIDRTLPAR